MGRTCSNIHNAFCNQIDYGVHKVKILGIYQHYKGKNYQLLAVATHSESQEKLAVYQALYGELQVWARPLSMFLENIEIEGRLIPRFKLVDQES